MILSATMLLDWHGARMDRPNFVAAAAAIQQAMDAVLEHPQLTTADLGGPLGTGAYTAEVVSRLS
ncbi:hypothetical protein D3C86_2122110 [compost metagenome]